MEIEGRSNQQSRNLTHLMRLIHNPQKLYPRGIQSLKLTQISISNRLLIPNEKKQTNNLGTNKYLSSQIMEIIK